MFEYDWPVIDSAVSITVQNELKRSFTIVLRYVAESDKSR